MDASDLAAVIIAIAALVATAVAVIVVIQVRRVSDDLRAVLEALGTNVDATLNRLDERTTEVEHEMQRIGGLIDSAERVTARADTLSKMTYGAVAKPVIKTAAVVRGTSRAARRLRRGPQPETDERAG